MNSINSLSRVSSYVAAGAVALAVSILPGCVMDEEPLASEFTPADQADYASVSAAVVSCPGNDKYIQFNYDLEVYNHPSCEYGVLVNGVRAVTRCCANGEITNPGGSNNFGSCGGGVPPRYGELIFNQCGTTCGNGIVEAPVEECDDGGPSADCTEHCMFPYE